MSDSAGAIKQCAQCYADLDTTDSPKVEAVEHFMKEHPDSEILASIIESTVVETNCGECGKLVVNRPTLIVYQGGAVVSVPLHCGSCQNEKVLRELCTRHLSAKELVLNEVGCGPARETVRLTESDVTSAIDELKVRCPSCDRSTYLDLPQGKCEYDDCEAELSLALEYQSAPEQKQHTEEEIKEEAHE